jgi:Zn-dependent M28 family amino/carboxypeptidase
MRRLVEDLCSDLCAGRAAGTAGGRVARALVMKALRDAGLDPFEQLVPACNGANVIATMRGDIDRWVLVAAHYDHLGRDGRDVYRGADDNAAAVAILVDVARALAAKRADGRGVIIAAFDAEEPPHFNTSAMGSMHFVQSPPVAPIDKIDMMVCMDLVGHSLGESDALPGEVRNTVFALGAERSAGTTARLQAIARAEPGVVVRAADAQIIPPLSDHAAFWQRERPFLFLTNGRSRRYHTVDDTPEHLDWNKMGATARWLERFVRDTCARDEGAFRFQDARSDVSTLDSLIDVLGSLAALSPQADEGLQMARALRAKCRADASLPEDMRDQVEMLVLGIERALE